MRLERNRNYKYGSKIKMFLTIFFSAFIIRGNYCAGTIRFSYN
jgi:hypothetical protein